MISSEVVFNDTMVPTVSKEKFLAKDRNKNRLITELMNRFIASNMLCKQAKEDADVLIINTALDMAHNHDNVIIIGEDVDLLVFLIGLCNSPNVYFLKLGKRNITQKIYSPMSAVDRTVASSQTYPIFTRHEWM
jgi:predicted nuclease of predicted toxin-antitoxin system